MARPANTPAQLLFYFSPKMLLGFHSMQLLFYFYKVVTEGRPSEYVPEIQAKYADTMVAGWKLWIPAHVINFAFVPNRQRILYANVISIAGTYILSRAQAGDFSSSKAQQEGHHRSTEVVWDGVVIKQD
jgi:hypothetical protein